MKELLVSAIAVVICICCWIGAAAIKAKTYNRVTGKNISTFDAMFIELRVTDNVK